MKLRNAVSLENMSPLPLKALPLTYPSGITSENPKLCFMINSVVITISLQPREQLLVSIHRMDAQVLFCDIGSKFGGAARHCTLLLSCRKSKYPPPLPPRMLR